VYLLDTNIVSEVLRRRPDRRVIARLRQVQPEEVHASVITLFELQNCMLYRFIDLWQTRSIERPALRNSWNGLRRR
jgi:predicted nucleic acid-binding protein